jgi:O-antigen/teichoic acid export membrane protein
MLLRHSAIYLLARGLPGLINLAALAVFTRLVSPEEYGKYVLVVAGASFANSMLFQWLRLGVLRFFPSYDNEAKARIRFLSSVAVAYLGLVIFTGILAVPVSLWMPSFGVPRELWFLGIGLLWAQAWFELNLELIRVSLAPSQYGFLAITKTAVALLAGGALAYGGWGGTGLIVGLLVGTLLPGLGVLQKEWRNVSLGLTDRILITKVARYGLPLTASFALNVIIFSAGRFMLGWFKGSQAVGVYAAAYDLTQHTIILLMMVVNLAAYPLAIHALEERGVKAAQNQLRQNSIMLFAIAFPAAVGLALVGENVAHLVLGAEFRDFAGLIIPWVAFAALIQGIKAYYLDLAFQLGERTIMQIWPVFAAAILNVVLNIWWIPIWDVKGAALAALLSYAAGLILSWRLGRRIFPLPFPRVDFFKIVLATLCMATGIWPVLSCQGLVALLGQMVLGGGIYGLMLWILNVGECRMIFIKFFVSKFPHWT